MKLVENARLWWKMWSIRLGAIGSAIVSIAVVFPDKAIEVWAIMPDAFKNFIPPQYMPLVGVAIYVLAMASRLIKQRKLDAESKQNG